MSHLQVLQSMFPNKVFLTVEDIAKIMNVSKHHVYYLSSAKKLPFKLSDFSDKLQVSIVEMAKYLDSKIEDIIENDKKEEIPVLDLVKKKGGRPRGSVTGLRKQLFQSQLTFCIHSNIVSEFVNRVSNIQQEIEFPNKENIGIEDLKDFANSYDRRLLESVASYEKEYLNLFLPPVAPKKRKIVI